MDKYFDPRAPGSFSGINTFHRELKDGTSKKEVTQKLRSAATYSLHAPVKRKFKTNRTVVYTKNELFQADLADVRSLSTYNKGVKYLLVCIDVFSKYAWVTALKDKSGRTLREALEKIFDECTPDKFQTDQGKEFENAECYGLFKKNYI